MVLRRVHMVINEEPEIQMQKIETRENHRLSLFTDGEPRFARRDDQVSIQWVEISGSNLAFRTGVNKLDFQMRWATTKFHGHEALANCETPGHVFQSSDVRCYFSPSSALARWGAAASAHHNLLTHEDSLIQRRLLFSGGMPHMLGFQLLICANGSITTRSKITLLFRSATFFPKWTKCKFTHSAI